MRSDIQNAVVLILIQLAQYGGELGQHVHKGVPSILLVSR
jgi:hypothetical protein